ncbi:Tn3 transposase DDE domain protein [Labrenzia sp. THAF82]|uniref:Tn3 family transposase n=1 Tax=Labrenzia sp. THAF82 TaxID=2587861 RepID=UPI0012685DB4|nr:Tn3 family transposase [Labrenzia sp. THAF82]QFT29434.1 Tn3 transposase DDE domain protein [Labrenzia sp. THAF82]
MPPRSLLSARARADLFVIPTDPDDLIRHYLFLPSDLDLIRTRRRDENRLGLAVHVSLLRYPGQGWRDGVVLPTALLDWLGDQLHLSASHLQNYASRGATRAAHQALALQHLDLPPFSKAHMAMAEDIATRAAFATDHGVKIVETLVAELRKKHLLLPSVDTLERLALKGRARARREAAAALFDALSPDERVQLQALLVKDPFVGQTRLTWLRGYPHSASPANMSALLDRLKYLRSLNLPPNLGHGLHPDRLLKFAREGAVAPVSLLNDFGERRRIATLAAQMADLSITLTDATIAMFERLTGQLFSRSRNRQEEVWRMGKTKVGKLMQLFGASIDAMARAQDLGQDPFAALDADVGWEPLLGKRDEIAGFGELATSDPLALAAERYTYMRKFAPAFLDAFEFKASDAGDDLKDAITLLRDQNRTGKRKLPDDPPMPFAAKHWQSLIIQDGQPQRRVYETAVVSTLRERLRAGGVWVDGSREYRRFDSYLKPRDTAEIIMRDAGFETDPDAWLSDRRATMANRLEQVERALKHNALPGARIERGRLKITPHDAVTPPAAVRLERAIDAVMPRIRITELLWEVDAQTGFLNAFTDLRSGKQHDEPAAVLATILVGATNLGLERMAHASSRISHAQLTWAQTWYLRPETFADALGRIVDAHHSLPFAQHWGTAEHSSSDGQFFAASRGSGLINAKYGPDPGLKIYSFLSGQYGSFHSNVIGATAGEAPFVLDSLLSNPASFDPLVHYTDTGGVSDHVFALFHLLGMTFAPRLRDFPDRRLACFGSTKAWPTLAPLIGKPINEEVIRQHWGDIMRLAASIRDKSLKPSEILRKLGAYRQQNRLYLALGEIGRIERTLFMLDWIENADLRMECHAGLNKSEARHSLARAVFAHSQGRIHDSSEAAQQKRAMALNLVITAITFWNTLYMDKAAKHLAQTSPLYDAKLLAHTSPLGWEHVSLSGDFDWHSGAADRKIARPLNIRPARDWGT